VSITTVSRVINDQAAEIGISPKTRDRVLAVAEEMGYQPNPFARFLRTKKSRSFGVVVAEMSNPYFGTIISGIEQSSNARGYVPLISSLENNLGNEKACVDVHRANRAGGILFAGTGLLVEEEILHQLAEDHIPVVFIGKNVEAFSIPCVDADNEKGAFLATEHLIQLGHRRIGIIMGPDNVPASEKRWEGYKRALEKYGLQYDERWVEQETQHRSEPGSGYFAMMRLLEKNSLPTAMFAFSDRYAFGAIRAAVEKGLAIPQDLAVVGFDNIIAAEYYNPPLTTVEQPMLEMGRIAADMLMDAIEGTLEEGRSSVILDPKLIVRESCGADSRMM
jgi:DNA-binding LacI/PurR family transcriptional regulator